MLTAISSTTFSESRVLSALLLERRFRAHLVSLGTLGEKRINNILAVLSKPLK